MNDTEKAAAEALLKNIASATAHEVMEFAQAYQCLTQSVLNRKQAEVTK